MKPHILHIFPSFEVGGAQTRTADWINQLGSVYRHAIVAMDGNDAARSLLSDEIRTDFLLPPRSPVGLLGRLRAYGWQLRTLRPDVLMTHNWGAIEWALANRLLARLPHLHVESGFGMEEAGKPLKRRVWGRRVALKNTFRVVVPSDALARTARQVWKLPPAQVLHIPDGIECARFRTAAPLSVPDWYKMPDVLVVGTVAALRPEKTLEVLIDAVAAVRAVRPVMLLVAGDGAGRTKLEAHARMRGLMTPDTSSDSPSDVVAFLGFVEAVEKIYPLLDVFALSSMTEQMPNAVLQAMAAGLPVVATRVGDIPLMVCDENRDFLVNAGDSQGMADAILRLAAAPDVRARLGQDNRRKVTAQYDRATMVQAYQQVLHQAMATHAPDKAPDKSAIVVETEGPGR